MYCKNCGGEVDENDYTCQHCGVRIRDAKTSLYENTNTTQDGKTKNDSSSIGLWIFSFLFPLLGIVLWIVFSDDRPKRAASCSSGAFYGFFALFIVFLITFNKVIAIFNYFEYILNQNI